MPSPKEPGSPTPAFPDSQPSKVPRFLEPSALCRLRRLAHLRGFQVTDDSADWPICAGEHRASQHHDPDEDDPFHSPSLLSLQMERIVALDPKNPRNGDKELKPWVLPKNLRDTVGETVKLWGAVVLVLALCMRFWWDADGANYCTWSILCVYFLAGASTRLEQIFSNTVVNFFGTVMAVVFTVFYACMIVYLLPSGDAAFCGDKGVYPDAAAILGLPPGTKLPPARDFPDHEKFDDWLKQKFKEDRGIDWSPNRSPDGSGGNTVQHWPPVFSFDKSQWDSGDFEGPARPSRVANLTAHTVMFAVFFLLAIGGLELFKHTTKHPVLKKPVSVIMASITMIMIGMLTAHEGEIKALLAKASNNSFLAERYKDNKHHVISAWHVRMRADDMIEAAHMYGWKQFMTGRTGDAGFFPRRLHLCTTSHGHGFSTVDIRWRMNNITIILCCSSSSTCTGVFGLMFLQL